ncbi:MAG: S8 family serine peptidase [Hamadaea sp.]|uniref:S8 family serine peptidase n=1 Tax=Hamadaea sp. TaxID=2024425 RepID=UPI001793FA92|nr:S8 family serine peptidase [Hamadaea sp.]NUR73645.1 S8 family serine peptidase [Hamadaea sp.]NUT20360.1 S8 family serine peptidase [Hamadaea sp.]
MVRPTKIVFSAVTALATIAFLTAGSAEAGVTPAKVVTNVTDGGTAYADVADGEALVQLVGDPLTTAAKTKPVKGKKIDFSNATVKSERARLSALRNDFKAWLRANAPKAKVTSEYDISLNAVAVQLNGESLGKIAAAPLVKSAQPQYLYHQTAADPDLGVISAVQAWQQVGGSAHAGEGVKVAVVDSGIDVKHPCFSDAGYPAQTQLGDKRYTNNKVIVAKVFANKAAVNGFTAYPGPAQEHGTHVSGTIACNFETAANIAGVALPYKMSGVAPRALLGNYNVFPGDIDNARSEDILNALDAAYADGFDVANMSLGGNAHGVQDLLTIAVDNLDEANMVVAVSAGNDGPGHYTVGSPGSAERALTAGASTVPHFMGAPVTVGGSSYGAALGDFGALTEDVSGDLAAVSGTGAAGLSTACTPISADLTGKIALIARGTCSFSEKIRSAQNAGAKAVLVVNNVGGDPIAMGKGGIPTEPTVPALQLSLADGTAAAAHSGQSVSIGSTLQYFTTQNVDIMAGFSSQGPTDVDFRVKPDVVAPGVNVLSSIPNFLCSTPPCFAFLQGTSMASPHLAGTAAVVRQLHPDWSAEQVRSAIVNTADQGVLRNANATALEKDLLITGTGRENVVSALNAVAAIGPVSTSFGAIPAGSGQSGSKTVTITNLSGSAKTFTLAVTPVAGTGVAFSVGTSSVTLAAGASTTVQVAFDADKGAGAADHTALLTISSGGTAVAHSVLYAFIK